MSQEPRIDFTSLQEIADAIEKVKNLKMLLAVLETHPFAYCIDGEFVEFDLLPAQRNNVAAAIKEAAKRELDFFVKRLQENGIKVTYP